MRTLDDVDLDAYDFFDFGAGDGASLRRCEEMFGGRGLGIDNKPSKVQAATANGADVVLGDITKLPRTKTVRYVCMDNFLEHLPDLGTACTMIEVAAAVATDFLYIAHPSFEDEPYLRRLGLKQFWQDWTGHPAHIMMSDFAAMLADVGAMPIDLAYVRPAWDSSCPSVLPLDTPVDQHHYDPVRHGPKPHIEFDRPIHWQIQITAHLNGEPPGAQSRVADLEREIERLRGRRSVRMSSAVWKVRQGAGVHGKVAGLRAVGRALRR